MKSGEEHGRGLKRGEDYPSSGSCDCGGERALARLKPPPNVNKQNTAALRRHRFHLPTRGPQSIAIVDVFLELHGPRDASAGFPSLPFVTQRPLLSLKPHAIAFSTISAESSWDIIGISSRRTRSSPPRPTRTEFMHKYGNLSAICYPMTSSKF